jgi:hypothetical protein
MGERAATQAKLPVIWHQTLLSFAVRYKNEITEDQVCYSLFPAPCSVFSVLPRLKIKRFLNLISRLHIRSSVWSYKKGFADSQSRK